MGRVVTVQDAGCNSEENKRLLQTAGGHYIIGEMLRQGLKVELLLISLFDRILLTIGGRLRQIIATAYKANSFSITIRTV